MLSELFQSVCTCRYTVRWIYVGASESVLPSNPLVINLARPTLAFKSTVWWITAWMLGIPLAMVADGKEKASGEADILDERSYLSS